MYSKPSKPSNVPLRYTPRREWQICCFSWSRPTFGACHVIVEVCFPLTVDGRYPANQLRLVVYPTIYKVLYIPGGAGVLPSTVWVKFPNDWALYDLISNYPQLIYLLCILRCVCELKISTLRSAFGGFWGGVSRFHTLGVYLSIYLSIYLNIKIFYILHRGCPTATEERSWSFGWSMMQQIPLPKKRGSRLSGDMMYYTWYPRHLLLHGYFHPWKMDVSPKNHLKWRCLGYQEKCLKDHIFISGVNSKGISFDKGSSCYQSHRLDNHYITKTRQVNGEKHGFLGYIEDYTTQLCGDLLINHCNDSDDTYQTTRPDNKHREQKRRLEYTVEMLIELLSFPSFFPVLTSLSLNDSICCMWLYLSLCVSGILVSTCPSSWLVTAGRFLVQTFGFSNSWRFPHSPTYGWYLNHKG